MICFGPLHPESQHVQGNHLLAANSPGMPRWISPSQTCHSFLGGTVAKNLPANAGDSRDALILGSGRSPGVQNGNPLQYSFLENSMDRGAWWAIQFMGCKESDMTEHMHTHTHTHTQTCQSQSFKQRSASWFGEWPTFLFIFGCSYVKVNSCPRIWDDAGVRLVFLW